jgi:F-type H+-transporting ATPase subunit gamma
MASAKDIRKKIRTISNTKKITRTMEMVATVKSKRAQDRIKATTPYSQKLSEILESLARSGSISHPFLTPPEKVERTLLLIVTGNRGLCGGYNSNVLGLAEERLEGEKQAGRAADTYMVGKKGISRFRFLKLTAVKTYTHIDDRPSFKDAADLAEEFMRRFLAGEVQRVVVVASKYFSASLQKPTEFQLLPIAPPRPSAEGPKGGAKEKDLALKDGRAANVTEFIFEPNREEILKALLPLSVKNAIYRILVEAAAAEQIARRIAMKLATDNAEEMIKTYTRKYNRQRQAGITQQIVEIVSGADALG